MKDKEIYTLVVYRSSADLWKRCTNHDAQVIWHKPPKSYEIIDWFWSCIKKQGSKYKIVKFRRTKKEQVEFILSCQTRKRGEGFVVYFDSIPAESIDMYEHWDLKVTERGERIIDYDRNYS